ncbi:MAG TPA: hypothetical protein VLT47_00435 [Anaeromyxobacteraceae bacterium]|nr:hypothetical protein [Anaeromyxobacteraceae bacterium]
MRHLVLAVPLALLAGCVVRTYGTYPAYGQPYASGPAPAAPRAEVYYYGNHFIPESAGGGWCYIDGPHTHDYYPDHDEWYAYDQGYYWYSGPFLFTFYGGHPLPGGGWCFINGPHQHDYFPPAGADWRWNRTGYVYEGQYRPNRPPPPTYWARPAPRVDYRVNRPSVRPAPAPVQRPNTRGELRPGPDTRWDGRPMPGRPQVEQLRPGPGQSGYAPGRGEALPPGQGGVPPGQARPGFQPPGPQRREELAPPGRGRPEFVPPGQVDRAGGRPDFTPPAREERGGGRFDRPAPSAPPAAPPAREERGGPRFDRPAFAPAPAPSAPPAAPPARVEERREKKEKKDDRKDDRSDDRPQRPGRGR